MNCRIRTVLSTHTTLHALGLVYMSLLMMIEINCPTLACKLTPVGNASSAGISDLISTDRTFIAGNWKNLDHIWILMISTNRHLDSFADDCTFLVDTAPGCRLITRNDSLWDIQKVVLKFVIESKP